MYCAKYSIIFTYLQSNHLHQSCAISYVCGIYVTYGANDVTYVAIFFASSCKHDELSYVVLPYELIFSGVTDVSGVIGVSLVRSSFCNHVS